MRGYHMTLCYTLCLSNFPLGAYQWLSWKDRTKDGSYPVISFAEVKEIRPSHTSHPETWVRDMWHDTTHASDRVSLPDFEQIHPQWKLCECVCMRVGVHSPAGGSDKTDSVICHENLFVHLKEKLIEIVFSEICTQTLSGVYYGTSLSK